MKRFLNGDPHKNCFFPPPLRHCGKPKGPKAEDVLFLCVSMRMCCIFLYHWYCDGYVYFLIVIAKLSLLGLKDSQLFVNLSSSLCIHPFFVAVSVLLIMPNLRGWVAQVAREEVFMRLLISSTVSVWNVQLNPIHSQGLVFSEPQETDPVGRPFWREVKIYLASTVPLLANTNKSLKGFGFSMGLNFHDIINRFTDWSNILTKSILFQVDF